MIRELHINLSPYNNLENLLKHIPAAVDSKVLHRIIERMQAEDELLDMIDESGAMPSRETILHLLAKEYYTDHIIDILGSYIRFV